MTRTSTIPILGALAVTLLSGCASTLVGQDFPQYRAYVCPLDSPTCPLTRQHQEYQILGTYRVENIAGDVYRVSGSVMVDTTDSIAAYTHSRLELSFAFFDGQTVTEQMKIIVRGKVNEFNRFSKNLTADKAFDSSLMIGWGGKVSQVPL